MIKILFLLLTTTVAFGQFNYTVNNGLQIPGVGADNPVIYDNDMIKDTPDAFYLYLKANRKEVNLVGNISSQQGHANPNPSETTPELWKQFNDVYNTFKNAGGQNVPAPVMGSRKNLTNGQTAPENSAGSDLIITEAKKASAAKPLVIFCGGQSTSPANAVLKDASIIPNIIVFHVNGWEGPNNNNFNAADGWACQVLIDRGVKYISWDGDLNSWYDGPGSPQYRGKENPPINRIPGVTFATINNSFATMYRNNFSHMLDSWGTIGDAPPVFYFFNHALWQNVVRKDKNNNTVTGAFSYLLVSQNQWTNYGPMLSSYMNNAANYIPSTATPPIEPPVQTQTPFKPLAIPGKIEAEDFDNGGEGVAYHDNEATNFGGKYRPNEGVDIEGNTNIGWTFSGEWLEYTPTTITAGPYKVEARVASLSTIGSLNVQVDGITIGTFTTPSTGGWQNWQTVSFDATIPAGKVIRINMLKGDTNIDWLSFTPIVVQPPVNIPPSVSLTNAVIFNEGNIELTATANDTDGTVSKVEFFNSTIELGEDITAPYSYNWLNVIPGEYRVTALATDNQGATTAHTLTIIVNDITIPPDTTDIDTVYVQGPPGPPGPKGDPGLDGVCPTCPPSTGTGSSVNDIAVFNVLSYGAKGDGVTDDTQAFQNAIIAARGAKIRVPPPNVEYVITRTLDVVGPNGQIWMDLEAWGWSKAGTNHIEYRGPSNTSVFNIVGLKGSKWSGLKVRILEGRTGVVVYDIDATPTAQSTTFNSFENLYTDLGNQTGNIAVRMGRLKSGPNHADICHYDFKNCVVYGKFQDPLAGVYGYQILGRNTLAISFFNCFTAYTDINVTNKAADGHRGNGTIFMFANGSSQNNIEFQIASEQTYMVVGGRFEGTKRSFADIADGAHSTLTVIGAQIDEIGEGNKDGTNKQHSPFIISSASTLSIDNCIINQKPTNLQPLVKINYTGPYKSTLSIRGGTVRTNANSLYSGKNANFRIYIEGVNRSAMGSIWSTDFWNDERP